MTSQYAHCYHPAAVIFHLNHSHSVLLINFLQFMFVLGAHCCVGYSLVAVHGLPFMVTSLVLGPESRVHRLQ